MPRRRPVCTGELRRTLDTKKLRAVLALCGKSYADVARLLQISSTNLHQLLRSPKFDTQRRIIEAVRAQLTVTELSQYTFLAVEEMEVPND